MNNQARAAKNAYLREWRKKHPDNTRKSQEKYWEKRAAKLAEPPAPETEQSEGGRNDDGI